MNVIIFTHEEDKIKEIKQNIINNEKLKSLGPCIVTPEGRHFWFSQKDIIIDIRLYYDYMIRVSRPRYFLFDDTCHSDFRAFVRFQLISLTDTDEAYNFNDLVNRIMLESED